MREILNNTFEYIPVMYNDKSYYKKLSDSNWEMLNQITLLEKMNPNIFKSKEFNKLAEEDFLIKIIRKRIEVLNLPIKFGKIAEVSISSVWCDRPGAVILLLIECLEWFEGKGSPVTLTDILSIYPFGFYKEEAMIEIIDKIKNKESGYKYEYIY